MIRKLRQIDYFFLIVIISFAFDFGYIKYALAGTFTIIYVLASGKFGARLNYDIVGRRYGTIFCGIGILLVITAGLQFVNGFNSYAINEAIYYVTPLMLIWVYTTGTSEKTIGMVMNYSFVVFVLSFFYTFIGQVTLEDIMNISFTKSYSPFESEKAFIFIVFECFYIFKNKKKKAFLSLALCVLSFKRICMVVGILIFVFANWFREKESVSKKVVLGVTAFFVLLPIVTCSILDGGFIEWFDMKFDIPLAELTLSRSDRIEMAMHSDEIKYGLGSVTTYITDALNTLHNNEFENRSLHNDLVKIYLECGIIGSTAFTYVFMKASSFSKSMFLLMCYIFVECYFNHLFGAGTASIWIIIYLFMAYVGKTMVIAEKEGNNGENNSFYTNL